ncbi:MAG: YhcB family protein [Gammaproteobacteria bacterium]|nr:YhcB family protein [Gammaproteobacteria bacterium]
MGTTIIIAGILFIVGLTVGGIAGRWRGKHDNKSLELEKEVGQLKTDMNQYRDEVGQHFNKTGELFNTMTQNYRDIYEHLATGAQKLSNDKTDVFQLNGFSRAPKLPSEGALKDEMQPPESQAPSDYAKPEPTNEQVEIADTTKEK